MRTRLACRGCKRDQRLPPRCCTLPQAKAGQGGGLCCLARRFRGERVWPHRLRLPLATQASCPEAGRQVHTIAAGRSKASFILPVTPCFCADILPEASVEACVEMYTADAEVKHLLGVSAGPGRVAQLLAPAGARAEGVAACVEMCTAEAEARRGQGRMGTRNAC